MSYTQTIIFASLGGILPALFWLWFWLREDRLHPEPKKNIILSFIGGMIIVPIAFYSQKYTEPLFTGVTLVLCWSLIEETLKLISAYFTGIRKKICDESGNINQNTRKII